MVLDTPRDTAGFAMLDRSTIHGELILLHLYPSTFDRYGLIPEAWIDYDLPRHPGHVKFPVQDTHANKHKNILSFNTTHVWELLHDSYPP
jgi:hypothetical protein